MLIKAGDRVRIVVIGEESGWYEDREELVGRTGTVQECDFCPFGPCSVGEIESGVPFTDKEVKVVLDEPLPVLHTMLDHSDEPAPVPAVLLCDGTLEVVE